LAGVGIFFGVAIIVLSILGIFIAIKLWKGKNWARIVTIVFAAICLLLALVGLGSATTMSIVYILVDAFIIWYLGFNATVKTAFK
ncbi:MAG: hypothetical protein Q7R95_04015, partial [bacterium]|nr:hypothetical protein [bacterium]